MSDDPTLDPNAWHWQGFECEDYAAGAAAKMLTDADPRAGVWVPPVGAPPATWDKARSRALWAVQTRRGDPIPCPAGCTEADETLVGRLVGA